MFSLYFLPILCIIVVETNYGITATDGIKRNIAVQENRQKILSGVEKTYEGK